MNNLLYHLKIALRSLCRNKFYSAINIGGLAIGMAATVLLSVWVYNQWSYDRFHAKTEQIHQVWNRAANNGPVECWDLTPLVIGSVLKDEYPEIIESVRVSTVDDCYFGEGDRQTTIRTLYADPSFLTVFSFPLLQGDAKTALNDPYSVILTEKTARRLFGNENPMGKTFKCMVEYPVTVTGVMKDLPDNTRFDFEILGSFQFVEKVLNRYGKPSWYSNSIYTYIELMPDAPLDKLNASVCDIIKKHTDNKVSTEAFLYPLDKAYLYNIFENGIPTGGRIIYLRMFAILAGFILLIACINFMNLSTARATLRAKEVGVRKVMGSRYIGLIRQFLGESLMLAFIAGIIAFIGVYVALPYFSGWLSGLSGRVLSLDIFDIRFWLFALVFILFTGLLAGCYPAFYLSAFRPGKVLKGPVTITGTRIAPRKVLVVLQFAFAIFLIIGTMVVRRQIVYAQNRDSGYDKVHLIYTSLADGIAKHYSAFRNDLMASGGVIDMTRTWYPMTEIWGGTNDVIWKSRDPEDRRVFDLYFADGNWAKMMGVEIVAGRYPDPTTYPTDSSAILINESAAKAIGFENPIGETLSFWGFEGHVTGVIKDFILRSAFEKIDPMIIGCEKIGWRYTLHIRLSPGKTADKLATVERLYKKYCPGYPFEYKFVDDEYAAKFGEVQSIESLAGFFTVIAGLISCMGLFALAAFTAERRKKEIGIRKVLGASVVDITLLLSKEYLVLTLVAFVVAVPLVRLVMNRFLDMFAYRTNIPVWLIVAVGIFILIIALLTVGWQAVKAATANPVKSIKTE